ncbi:unnamed protein product [Rotaria sp. Silwood2]|nr:unnamed protein product [Rotaria sp. Silwood2]
MIRSSDVRPGDHLYRYRWLKIQQGVAVRFPKLTAIFVVTYYKNTLTLVTLKQFKGQSCLRRITYKQDNNNYAKTTKFTHCRPPEEIVQNAFLLLSLITTSPDRVKSLLANDLSQFARRCCTTVHEQWSNIFHPNQEQTSRKKHFFDTSISYMGDSTGFIPLFRSGLGFSFSSSNSPEDSLKSIQQKKNYELVQ